MIMMIMMMMMMMNLQFSNNLLSRAAWSLKKGGCCNRVYKLGNNKIERKKTNNALKLYITEFPYKINMYILHKIHAIL